MQDKELRCNWRVITVQKTNVMRYNYVKKHVCLCTRKLPVKRAALTKQMKGAFY